MSFRSDSRVSYGVHPQPLPPPLSRVRTGSPSHSQSAWARGAVSGTNAPQLPQLPASPSLSPARPHSTLALTWRATLGSGSVHTPHANPSRPPTHPGVDPGTGPGGGNPTASKKLNPQHKFAGTISVKGAEIMLPGSAIAVASHLLRPRGSHVAQSASRAKRASGHDVLSAVECAMTRIYATPQVTCRVTSPV